VGVVHTKGDKKSTGATHVTYNLGGEKLDGEIQNINRGRKKGKWRSHGN